MDLLDLLNDGMARKPPDTNALLFSAASRGDMVTFKRHLDAGGNVFHLTNGFNCMHIAVKRNRADIVKYILLHTPSARRVQTTDGRSCEMLASFEGLADMVTLLQDTDCSGAEGNDENGPLPLQTTTDNCGNTALHYAAWGGHSNCVDHLVRCRQCDIFCVNQEGMDALHFASAGNHVDCIKEILLLMHDVASANVSAGEAGGRTCSGMGPLHRAAMHGSVEVVQLLLTHCRENPGPENDRVSRRGLFEQAENGNSPLHIAAHRGMTAIVRALLAEATDHLSPSDREAYINMPNNFGLSAVHFACIGYVLVYCSLYNTGASSLYHMFDSVPLALLVAVAATRTSFGISLRPGARYFRPPILVPPRCTSQRERGATSLV